MSEIQPVQSVQNIMISEFLSLTNSVRTRLIANFFKRISTDVVIPFMTIFIAQTKGETIAGLLIICILCLGVFFNGLGGKLSCKFETKKTLVIGELLHAFSVIAMAITSVLDVNLMILFYFIKNIIFSFLVPFSEKVIFDNTSSNNRQVVYQFNSILSGMALPIGMLLGALLFKISVEYLLFLSFLFSFFVFVIYSVGLKKTKVINNEYRENTVSYFNTISKNKPAILIIISAVLLNVIQFSFLQFLPVYLSSFKYGVEQFSISRVMNGVVNIVFGLLLIPIIKASIATVGKLRLGIVIFSFMFSLSIWLSDMKIIFFMLIFLMSCCEAFINPLQQSIYAEYIEKQSSGVYLSAFSLTGRFGNIGASILLILSDYLTVNIITSIILILGLTSAFLVPKK
ncbi:MFS transporter [Xenorhabdus indica]|uniref:MFS transporter n=1 Tax=Xenorhabdus indica TaxID=333964 RepID=UPI0030D7C56A